MNTIDLWQGDCLELMKDIPNNSINTIFADLPYKRTANSWDIMIDPNLLWEQYCRLITKKGAILLTASEPFSSIMVCSNVKMFRYKWIWNKNNSAGFASVKRMPFQITEDILVFGKQFPNYYPIMEERGKPRIKGGYSKSENYHVTPTKSKSKSNKYYPKNIIPISNANQKGKIHPTQKPEALLEYLLRTYTLENDTVLDNTMGSGTTGVVCKKLNRNFIGIEKDKTYFDKALQRINE